MDDDSLPLAQAVARWVNSICIHGPICLTVTGSGGKTSTMEQMGRYWAQEGRSVLLSTSTRLASSSIHTYQVDRLHLVQGSRCTLPKAKKGQVVLFGIDDGQKISSCDEKTLCEAASRFDVTILEGDGARSRALKIHAERDPVVFACSNAVVAVMGLGALGKALDEQNMYLSDRYRELTGDTAHVISPAVYRMLLEHPEGVFKRTGDLPVLLLCNQSDAVGELLMQEVVTSLRDDWQGRPYTLICGSWKTGTVACFDWVAGSYRHQGGEREHI